MNPTNIPTALAGLPNPADLLLERDGSTLRITLNRPEVRNAMSQAMWLGLGEVFDAIRDDRSLRAVVLCGAGGHFSAGGNTKERGEISGATVDAQATALRNRLGGSVLAKIDEAPQVVIAVVQGSALGGGLGLSCAADVVIADETASFRLPEASIGVIPAQIAPYLVRRIGMSQARRLALTAAVTRGSDALALGLTHYLCEGAQALEERLQAVLADIDRCGPQALAATKQLLAESAGLSGPDYIDAASRRFATVYCSDEGQEGARALRERRAPQWQVLA